MSYDELERLTAKTYPNTIAGKTENVSYAYDTCSFGLGKLCVRVDESGAYSYDYDAYGNLSNSYFLEKEGITYATRYQYDDGDRLSQTTLPSGRVVDYQRDGVRRIQRIDSTLNGINQNIVRDIQYRGDNQLLQSTFGNNLSDSRSYDLQGRLTSQHLQTDSSVTIDQRNYSYDKNSNILNIDTNDEDNAYVYDKLDRVLSDTINADTPIDFSYDLNNNRLSKVQDLSTDAQYQQQTNSNRISEVDALQIGVIPLAALPNRDLVYNNVGRLYQLIEDGTLKADYLYNDAGQRTRKTLYQSDGITVDAITIYHYDQMGYLVTETSQTGQLIKDYLWQEGMTPLAQIDDNAGTESISYLYTDHLMTNRLATNQQQQVIWLWEGGAFGNTPAQELTATQVNLRFPGQYFDQETNLHYNWNRYYDPSLGRYITSDPIGLDGGNNTYSYVGGNVLKYIDPEGNIKWIGVGYTASFVITIGAFYSEYTVTSKCVNGKKGHAKFAATGAGAAIGIKVSAVSYSVEFEDGDTEVNPSNFEGWYSMASAGYTAGPKINNKRRKEGVGLGYAIIFAGNAISSPSKIPSLSLGIDRSIGVLSGRSWLKSYNTSCC